MILSTNNYWKRRQDMTTLEMFYEAATKAFKSAGIEGDLQGIKVENGEVYFLHCVPTWPLKATPWENAAGTWEGIYRSLRNANR